MAKKKPKRGRRPDPKSLRSQGVTDRHLQPRKAFHGPPELFAMLADYCKAVGVSESQTMRDALEEFLIRHTRSSGHATREQ